MLLLSSLVKPAVYLLSALCVLFFSIEVTLLFYFLAMFCFHGISFYHLLITKVVSGLGMDRHD